MGWGLNPPEDDDPGAFSETDDGTDGVAYGQGCTNGGIHPADCLEVFGHGLVVTKIRPYIHALGTWTGRFEVLIQRANEQSPHLFLRSAVTTAWDGVGWAWTKGWTFGNGDYLFGGFWLSGTPGRWYDEANGPARITIHS